MRAAIVSPVFNEENTVAHFFETSVNAVKEVKGDYHFSFTFVDDGSSDKSLAKLLQIKETSSYPVKIVSLSRNFGYSNALTAGIFSTDADIYIIIDSDMEDPPELIPSIIKEYEKGHEVVYTVKTGREGTMPRKLLFNIFHFIFSRITQLNIPEGSGSFSLMTKKFIDEFRNLNETNRFIPGIRSFIGFKPGYVSYQRGERMHGNPRQSLGRLIDLALNAVFLFSKAPSAIVATTFAASLLFLAVGVLFAELTVKTLLLLTMALLVFIIMNQAIYTVILSKTLEESLKRPLYIVDKIYD